MNPDEVQLAKTGIEQALKPYNNLIEKLLGPAAEGIGDGLRAMVGPWVIKRQIRFWRRAQEMIAEAGFEPNTVPLKIMVPILQGASLEDNDDLQDMWAAMLANAAEEPAEVPLIFPEILRQLSVEEVKSLQYVYSLSVFENDSEHLYEKFERYFLKSSADILANRGAFQRAIDNLTRLGIIADVRDPNIVRTQRFFQDWTWKPANAFQIRSLGLQLIRACQPPHQESEKARKEAAFFDSLLSQTKPHGDAISAFVASQRKKMRASTDDPTLSQSDEPEEDE